MKKLFILSLLFSVFISAQNNRVIYEYTFRPDSTKVDSLKTEWMYLDITPKGSKYYSKKAFESDSIIQESVKKQLASGMRSISVSRTNQNDEVSYEIEKKYPDYKITMTETLGNDTFIVTEDRKINWKILPEKQKIGEFNTQKATADFAGRKWTAWFTTEVPIIDGPYKFSGLPGLIVQLSDQTESHQMELKGIKKILETKQENVDTKGRDIPLLKKTPILVNRNQYNKKVKEYENDPVQGMREMMNRPNSKFKVNIDGKEFSDPKEILRVMEEKAKEDQARNNNKIELKP